MMQDCFNRLKEETLLSFPYMGGDPVREEIDDVVTEALGLDSGWVSGIRFGLSREPSVTEASALK